MADPTSPQDRDFLELASGSAAMFRLFRSHIDAGFTEPQAMQLLIGTVSTLTSQTLGGQPRPAAVEPPCRSSDDHAVAQRCRDLYNRWTWTWMRGGPAPEPQQLHHELYTAILDEPIDDAEEAQK